MRKKRLIFTLTSSLILGFVGAVTVTSCGSSATVQTVVVQGAKNGKIGDKIQLTATVIGDESNKVTWESNDISVATVNENGLVELVGVGTVGIKATSVSDPSKNSSYIQITCFSSEEVTKKLEIVSLPDVVKYKTGGTLSFTGLKVSGYSFYGDIRDNASGVDFENSELKFSMAEGTKLAKGQHIISIAKDGYTSASFKITVEDRITETRLTIKSLPTKVRYTLSEDTPAVFNSSGLVVSEANFVDGVYKDGRTLKDNEYTLSITNGTKLTEEGNYVVDIISKKADVVGANFSIIVFTKNTSVYDLMAKLQNEKYRNYEVEVLNNVGTINDSTGFHYKRTYTKDYYEETEYQNELDTSTGNIIFTDKPKAQYGYTGYKDVNGESGIMRYEYQNWIPTGSTIISTSSSNWWDKANTLVNTFDGFDLSLLPQETLNGRFITINIEQVPGDNEMGDQTIAKYPLIEQFLAYCGWSSNLITIMSRFEVSFTGEFGLSMKSYFGNYGTTEMRVTKFGDCKIPEIEDAINNGLIKPSKVVPQEMLDAKELLIKNNYTRNEYTSESGATDKAIEYFHENYYFNDNINKGYAKFGDGIYEFSKTEENGLPKLKKGEKVTTDFNTIPEYISSLKDINISGYTSIGLSGMLGTGIDSNGGTLHTFALYSNFSTPTQRCYQSFEDKTKASVENYFGSGKIENTRIWHIIHYKNQEYVKQNISKIELWNIDLAKGRGNVAVLGNFGNVQLNWVEEAIK